mmetsp:Transcript_114890/g.357924  ORF Transcript_114890/g.357924 Transcript_114890/m.357924 type:complete len:210 (-) Transcript_114890:649-1278(-)
MAQKGSPRSHPVPQRNQLSNRRYRWPKRILLRSQASRHRNAAGAPLTSAAMRRKSSSPNSAFNTTPMKCPALACSRAYLIRPPMSISSALKLERLRRMLSVVRRERTGYCVLWGVSPRSTKRSPGTSGGVQLRSSNWKSWIQNLSYTLWLLKSCCCGPTLSVVQTDAAWSSTTSCNAGALARNASMDTTLRPASNGCGFSRTKYMFKYW